MAQITDKERLHRISDLLNELNKVPPERHEVERVPGINREAMLCPVIVLGADELLLNHRSHRVRAQLEDDPEWVTLRNDPHSEAAQGIIARYIRNGRDDQPAEQFLNLKESLLGDGQQNPGLITHDGVLINGNTRAVAIREFNDPGKRHIRVAVLPQTVKPADLNLFELRLQMQKELKSDYSMTNELLFVEELRNELKLTTEQIARELRIFPESAKKGATEVSTRLQILDLIRTMQRLPQDHLKLTFFNSFAYEQMREILRAYNNRLKEGIPEARRYLENILLSALVGITSVHQLRRIDETFMADYMVPRLEEDEEIGTFTEQLLSPADPSKPQTPAGVHKLVKAGGGTDPGTVELKRLIDALAQKSKTVTFTAAQKNVSLDKANVTRAIKEAVIVGIREKKLLESAEDKLGAPAETLKKATGELAKFSDAFALVAKDPEFDNNRQQRVAMAFRKLKKRYREVEATLAKLGL